MPHTKADTDRQYRKSKERGKGLLQTEATYRAEAINMAQYLNTKCKEDLLGNIAKAIANNHEINNSNSSKG
jgi:putative methionine-R-sulfoxide reductase with GAF domain